MDDVHYRKIASKIRRGRTRRTMAMSKTLRKMTSSITTKITSRTMIKMSRI